MAGRESLGQEGLSITKRRFREKCYPRLMLPPEPRERLLIDIVSEKFYYGPSALANLLLRLAYDAGQDPSTGRREALQQKWQGPADTNRARRGWEAGELVVSAVFWKNPEINGRPRSRYSGKLTVADGQTVKLEGQSRETLAASGKWKLSPESGLYWLQKRSIQPSFANTMASIFCNIAADATKGLAEGSVVPEVMIVPGIEE